MLFLGDTLPLRTASARLHRVVAHALSVPAPAARLVAIVWTHDGEGVGSMLRLHFNRSRCVGCIAEIKQAGEGAVVARGEQQAELLWVACLCHPFASAATTAGTLLPHRSACCCIFAAVAEACVQLALSPAPFLRSCPQHGIAPGWT